MGLESARARVREQGLGLEVGLRLGLRLGLRVVRVRVRVRVRVKIRVNYFEISSGKNQE